MIKLIVENSWTTIEIEQYQLNQLSDIVNFTYNYFIYGVVCPNEDCGKVIPSAKWMKNKTVMNCWVCKKPIFIHNNMRAVNQKEIIPLLKNNKIPTGLLTKLIPKLKELKFEYQIFDKRTRILPSNYDNCIEELRYYQKDAAEIALKKCRGIIKHPTGSGKCLKFDSLITTIDGSIKPIKKIFSSKNEELLTINTNLKTEKTKPIEYYNNGIKPCYKVTTHLGKEIEVTNNHPFLTIDGWKELKNLKTGDYIATPRILPIFGTETYNKDKLIILAHLIANGSLTKKTITLTESNQKIVDDLYNRVKSFDNIELKQKDYKQNKIFCLSFVKTSNNNNNNITNWIKELGLYGKKSGDKFIPDFVFKLTKDHISVFLNRLFATDGWCSLMKSNNRFKAEIGYCSKSKTLIYQIQHLLLRFGILSRIRTRKVKKYPDNIYYSLTIINSTSIINMIKNIGIFQKETITNSIYKYLSNKKRNENIDIIPIDIWNIIKKEKNNKSWNYIVKKISETGHSIGQFTKCPTRTRLLKIGEILNSDKLKTIANSDIFWDKIESIEYSGEFETYDLTIDNYHNFIANDIIVHNTILTAYLAFNTTPPCLIIVPDLTLLNQTYNKFKKWSKSLSIGKVGEGVFDPGDITIATPQTLNSRFETYEVKELLKSINSIYLDECHHVSVNDKKVENTWYNIIMSTNAYYRFGFSATVGMEGSIDRTFLESATGSLIHEISADELVKAGFLSQPIVDMYEIPNIYNGESGWSRIESTYICNNFYRNSVISRLSEKHSANGSVLISVNKIIHGENIKRILKDKAVFIHGNSKDREEVISKFKNKEIKILITTLLKEGADIPMLQTIINAGGGTGYRNDSTAKEIGRSIIQKAGRVLRIADNKTEGRIIDFIDLKVPMLKKHSRERIKTYEKEGFIVNIFKELIY